MTNIQPLSQTARGTSQKIEMCCRDVHEAYQAATALATAGGFGEKTPPKRRNRLSHISPKLAAKVPDIRKKSLACALACITYQSRTSG